MEMINRYIYAVTQKLPQAQRKDIADELRGLIEDMLDERVLDRRPNDHEIEDVLVELGSPRALADKYRETKKYLIGPDLFDSYMFTFKIVVIVVSITLLISFLIQTSLNPGAIADHFIEFIVSLVTGLSSAFAWTTFGFALGEYFGGDKQGNLHGEEWKPSDLAPIPEEKKKIKRSEPIVGIIFMTAFLAILIFKEEYLGVWIIRDEFIRIIPILNEQTYGSYMVFIMLLFGTGIVKECLKLVFGKWTYKLAIYTTIVNVISTGGILFMISKDDFWNPTFLNELVAAEVVVAGSEAFSIVSNVWNQLTIWLFILLIVGLLWDATSGFLKARK